MAEIDCKCRCDWGLHMSCAHMVPTCSVRSVGHMCTGSLLVHARRAAAIDRHKAFLLMGASTLLLVTPGIAASGCLHAAACDT